MWLNYSNSITSQVWIIDIQQPWLSKNFVYGKWREHLRTPVPLLDGGEILAFLFTLSADDAVLRRGQPLLDNKAGGLNIQLQLEKPKRGLDGLNAESMFSWDLPLISQDTSTSWMLKQHGVACRPPLPLEWHSRMAVHAGCVGPIPALLGIPQKIIRSRDMH